MKLHIGCGMDKLEGYLNLDSSKIVNPDVVWDLETSPLPFEDNTFHETLANHVLEHIHKLIPLMLDLWRINKADAIININTPFYASWG